MIQRHEARLIAALMRLNDYQRIDWLRTVRPLYRALPHVE